MTTMSETTCLPPKLIIVIGVSGSGKSTLAERLAQLVDGHFIEADDYHSDEAKLQMSKNIPLNDAQRAPWITSICNDLVKSFGQHEVTFLAFSGLKAKYRQPFRELGYNIQFYLLHGDAAIIANRMANRDGHFVSAGLLDSQFATLELPTENEKDIVMLDLAENFENLINTVAKKIILPLKFDQTTQQASRN